MATIAGLATFIVCDRAPVSYSTKTGLHAHLTWRKVISAFISCDTLLTFGVVVLCKRMMLETVGIKLNTDLKNGNATVCHASYQQNQQS